jgi:ABC-type glycerol-3-phosphate transport system permease component
MDWMAWTLPTALFFVAVALMFVIMTVWQLASPSLPRRGFLPMTTTRGDRLFVGLLGSAFINLAWLGLTDQPQWGGVALAHLVFNVPLAVWILEGFMSGVPKEIDETAYLDGYSFPRFFITVFLPLIRAGVGVTAFFCFMFSWVELLLARTLTSVNAKPIAAVMTRTVSASGLDWGVLTAAGVLTLIPGALVIWFVRNHIAKGFALGRV